MLTKANDNVNFGKAYSCGIAMSISNKAKRIVKSQGAEAIKAVDAFLKENVMIERSELKPSYSSLKDAKGWFQKVKTCLNNIKQAFLVNDCGYADIAKISVRSGKRSTSGKDTLIMKYHRNVSGKELGYSTQELDFTTAKTKEDYLKILNGAKNKAKTISDDAHDTWAIGDYTVERENH